MSIATHIEDMDLDGGAAATAFTLDTTYVAGGLFQYGVEWLRNVEHVHQRMVAAGLDTSQVKAQFDFVQTKVLDIETGSLVADPVLRRAWNIGTPMHPEDELLAIYSKLNIGGGENRWSPKNLGGSYGMGVRAAILYWSDALFITTVPGRGSFGVFLRQYTTADGTSTYHLTRPVIFDDGDTVPVMDKMFELPDEAGLYIKSPDGKNLMEITDALVDPEVREKGGVTIVFLGKDGYTEDVEFDPFREGETSRGIAKWLTNRFIGGHFPVTVQMRIDGAGEKAAGRVRQRSFEHAVDGTTVYVDQRELKTLADWTSRAMPLTRVDVDKHGTTITPYLLPEDYFHEGSFTDEEKAAEQVRDPKAHFEYRADKTWGKVRTSRDQWLPFDGQGQAVVLYKDEMYVLKDASEDRAKALSQWGISKPGVARRVLLVIEPRAQETYGPGAPWGITQNAARSNVTGPNGTSLPIATWQSEFVENFPKEIAEALAVRPVGKDRLISEDEIERLRDRALGTKGKTRGPKVDVEAEDPDKASGEGDLTGDTVITTAGLGKHPGAGKDGATKESRVVRKGDRGGIKSMSRTTKLPMPPQPRFLDEDEWADAGYSKDQFCHVSLEGGSYAIELNRGDKVYATQVDYYWNDLKTGHFSKPGRKGVLDRILRNHGGRTPGAKAKAEVAVIAEIEYVYRHDALAQFLGAMARYVDEKGRLDRALFNEAVTNGSKTMTVGLSALYPQQASITDRLNSLAGRKS